MKIAIVGTGALGGWYAGLLAQAGHEVHCVARSDYQVIQDQGILLRRDGQETRVRVASAHPDATAIGVCEWVIITTKSTANAQLPALLSPLVGPQTKLLTLQNGMGNVDVLAAVAPLSQIVAGLCFVCINRTAPAVIETTLAGYVRMAAAAGEVNAIVREAVQIFAAAGVDCQSEPSLEAVLWKKLCWNIPFNGLSIAAGGLTTDLILADGVLAARARHLMQEVQGAAVARGCGFPDSHVQRQFDVTKGMGAYRPSSLIDFVEGRDVEVEGIWGEPLRRGEAAGAPMHALRVLLTEIRQRLQAR